MHRKPEEILEEREDDTFSSLVNRFAMLTFEEREAWLAAKNAQKNAHETSVADP